MVPRGRWRRARARGMESAPIGRPGDQVPRVCLAIAAISRADQDDRATLGQAPNHNAPTSCGRMAPRAARVAGSFTSQACAQKPQHRPPWRAWSAWVGYGVFPEAWQGRLEAGHGFRRVTPLLRHESRSELGGRRSRELTAGVGRQSRARLPSILESRAKVNCGVDTSRGRQKPLRERVSSATTNVLLRYICRILVVSRVPSSSCKGIG